MQIKSKNSQRILENRMKAGVSILFFQNAPHCCFPVIPQNLFIKKFVDFITLRWPRLQGLLELTLPWLCLTWALIPWPTALPYTSHCNLIWVQFESFVYLLLKNSLIQQGNFFSDIAYLPKLKLRSAAQKYLIGYWVGNCHNAF
jgi:hypothetical protein